MSAKVMGLVINSALVESPLELTVALVLGNRCDDEFTCYPSIPSIARDSRMTERGVRQILQRMRTRGLLTIEDGGGRGNRNHYRLFPSQTLHGETLNGKTGFTIP